MRNIFKCTPRFYIFNIHKTFMVFWYRRQGSIECKTNPYINVKGWRSSVISKKKFYNKKFNIRTLFTYLPQFSFCWLNKRPLHADDCIDVQFDSFGGIFSNSQLTFAGIPQFVSGPPKSARKSRNEKRSDKGEKSVMPIDQRDSAYPLTKNEIQDDKALIIGVFGGLLTGYIVNALFKVGCDLIFGKEKDGDDSKDN